MTTTLSTIEHQRTTKKTMALIVVIVGLLVAGGLAARSLAQEQAAARGGPSAGIPDLVGGLKAIEGCLGVETAMTSGGKQVIFAWFESKKAVLNWYYSDMHRGVQKAFFSDIEFRQPLEGVPDDIGPIMVIASITMASNPNFDETSLPISQIAIELYKPITGGLYLGGRFAPESLKVPGMQDYTPGR